MITINSLCTGNNTNRGFTLIELLIAMTISAGIILLAQQALSGAITTEARVKQAMVSVNQLQRTWYFVNDDLLHAVPRPWVDQFENTQASMAGLLSDRQSLSSTLEVVDNSYLLRFIRSGDHNFFQQARSNLQVIAYRLTKNEEDVISLWRDYWRPVDAASEPTVKSLLLLDNIRDIQFRYLSGDSQRIDEQSWVDGWPLTTGQNEKLPIAVEMSITLDNIDEIKRLFLLSDSSVQ